MADTTYQPKTYRTDGGDKSVIADGGTLDIESGGSFEIAGVPVTASAAKLNSAAQELTVSGAVTAGVNAIELNHASGAIAATIADLANHQGLLVIKDTSATGTAGHTVTATAGTFDGTNNVVTLNALNECIAVFIDSAGNGTILENVGEVGLS